MQDVIDGADFLRQRRGRYAIYVKSFDAAERLHRSDNFS